MQLARRRLRGRMWPILQTAAAWYLAVALLDRDQPLFAPIAAVIALGATVGQRGQRAVELVGGVVLGIAVADLIVAAIGTGPWQAGVMIVLAMGTAVALGGRELLVAEAAVSAILIATLPGAGAGFPPDRFVEAIITPACHGPVPIAATIRSATAIPSTTPPTSSTARCPRWPTVAPSAITAAIGANSGSSRPSKATARYHAATAAAAVWKIGHMRPRSRRRASCTGGTPRQVAERSILRAQAGPDWVAVWRGRPSPFRRAAGLPPGAGW